MHISALLFRRVGDSLLATPALRALKAQYSAADLTVIAEPQVARVFAGNPHIRRLIVVDPAPSVLKLAAAIRETGRPDITLDFLSDPRSALACLLSGARRRVGIGRRWAFTDSVAPQDPAHPVYSAQHKLNLITALGISAADWKTDFYLNDDDREFAAAAWDERGWNTSTSITAFFVHSRREYKRWPAAAFCNVIRRLLDERLSTPLILVTPGDESAVAELRARSNLPPEHVLPIQDLGQLGAVLARCRLLIGNDGGPKHIAVALDIPTVTIFGPDPAEYWTPPNQERHIAITSSGDGASGQGPVGDVSVDAVFTAAQLLLEGSRP